MRDLDCELRGLGPCVLQLGIPGKAGWADGGFGRTVPCRFILILTYGFSFDFGSLMLLSLSLPISYAGDVQIDVEVKKFFCKAGVKGMQVRLIRTEVQVRI